MMLLIMCAAMALCSGAVVAQSDDSLRVAPDPVLERERPAIEVASTAEQKINLARRLMRDRAHLAASAILEQLYEENEANPVVINLLLNCYEHLGYAGKAEIISRRQVERHPGNVTYRLRLAEAVARQSRLDEARSIYRETLALLPDSNQDQCRLVVRSLIDNGLEDEALAVIDSARTRLGDPRVFAFARGEVLERQRKYRLAALEFCVVLPDSGGTGIEAEKKLQALLEYPESSKEAEQVLLELMNSEANVRAASVLLTYYLKVQRFDRAFEFAVVRDSLQDLQGAFLLSYIRDCRERAQYREAVRMAQYVLGRRSDNPIIGETYFVYADALVHLGRYQHAVAVYDSIFTTFPRPEDKAAALYGIGEVYLNHLHDFGQARLYFDSVVNHIQRGHGYIQALLAQPRCRLRQGDLPQARGAFEALLKQRLNGEDREMVEYHLALIRFLEKAYDSSEVALRKLIVDYPRGFYVNDALQMLMLIDRADGAASLLSHFSSALLFEQMWQPDSVAAKLELLASDSNRALADVALYRLAILELDLADSTAAIGFIEQLEQQFPESYYIPYGLKTKADVFLSRTGKREEAQAIYRRLLEEFPDYPFISEVRQTVRALEGEA